MRSLADLIRSFHRCTASMGLLLGVGVGLIFVTASRVMERRR